MLIDKLRRLLRSRSINILELSGVNGKTNSIELRNALKKLGVSSREIDMILEMLVYNGDGMIDLHVFAKKL